MEDGRGRTWDKICDAEYPSRISILTFSRIKSKPRRVSVFLFGLAIAAPSVSTSIASPSGPGLTSMPSARAKSCTIESGTTPAISWTSRAVIGSGGMLAADKRAADWRYVMARRRSPLDVEISAERTGGETVMCSLLAICWRRADEDVMSRGLKRNLEQRDASGSMILSNMMTHGLDEAETREVRRTELHSCTQGRSE